MQKSHGHGGPYLLRLHSKKRSPAAATLPAAETDDAADHAKDHEAEAEVPERVFSIEEWLQFLQAAATVSIPLAAALLYTCFWPHAGPTLAPRVAAWYQVWW